jgi:hypothetical protein
MSDEPPKPLSRLQAYLVETKKCVGLLREILVEIKDLLAILTVILFFIFGVYEALSRLASQSAHAEGQTHSQIFRPRP